MRPWVPSGTGLPPCSPLLPVARVTLTPRWGLLSVGTRGIGSRGPLAPALGAERGLRSRTVLLPRGREGPAQVCSFFPEFVLDTTVALHLLCSGLSPRPSPPPDRAAVGVTAAPGGFGPGVSGFPGTMTSSARGHNIFSFLRGVFRSRLGRKRWANRWGCSVRSPGPEGSTEQAMGLWAGHGNEGPAPGHSPKNAVFAGHRGKLSRQRERGGCKLGGQKAP